MRLWKNTKEFPEGKFLIVRRDGTVPAWPSFILGGRDPAATAALLAYADEAERLGYDTEFVDDVRALASEFREYRDQHGHGDADAAPHRQDDPNVIRAMRGESLTICVTPGPNKPKGA